MASQRWIKAVASTAIAQRVIRWLAGLAPTPRSAVAWVALFSVLSSLISWGLSPIFSGLLVREMAQRITGLDYRAAGAAAYIGLVVTWAMGQLVVQLPIVFLLCWLFSLSIPFVPPIR